MGCETASLPHCEYTSMNHPNPATVSHCHPPVLEDEVQQPDKDSDRIGNTSHHILPKSYLLEVKESPNREVGNHQW